MLVCLFLRNLTSFSPAVFVNIRDNCVLTNNNNFFRCLFFLEYTFFVEMRPNYISFGLDKRKQFSCLTEKILVLKKKTDKKLIQPNLV